METTKSLAKRRSFRGSAGYKYLIHGTWSRAVGANSNHSVSLRSDCITVVVTVRGSTRGLAIVIYTTCSGEEIK